jgi:type VI secretion system protein ImpF
MGSPTTDLRLNPSLLDRLLDDDPRAGTPLLDRDDFKKPSVLAAKLRGARDPISNYLKTQFLPETQRELDRYESATQATDDLQHQMVVGINEVIRRGCIYDQERFAGVRLPKDVMRLIEDTPRGVNVPLLNRMLLDEAYPNEIHKMRRLVPNYSIRQLKDDVARDLAALLNTRQELQFGVPEEYKELKGSLLEYGVPDFTSLSLMSTSDRKRIRREVELAIALFEPRLRSVQVVLEPANKFDQVLRFRIDALMRLDEASEPVSFDAVLQMATCEYAVRGA